ncbi:MAG: chemotaxis protein CheB, partial [Gammaproteobacteria bacterium]
MKKSFVNVISEHKIKAIVIGTSSGGITALEKILSPLPSDYPLPIMIVQHISIEAESYLIKHFKKICHMEVCEVNDLDPIINGKIYFAPPGYHLMIEPNHTFSLCVGEKISYSRPAIDV